MKSNVLSASIAYEPLGWPRLTVAILMMAVTSWYMVWRLGTLNPDAPIFSAIFYAVEAFGVLTLFLHFFMVSRLSIREAPEPKAGHTVDVFIPTIDEPLEVIRRTAIKALDMDYLHQTYILDDGNRESIRALAEELGCHYLARDTSEHAKAGNLNYGLKHSDGEFIALFDADHAPANNFLLRTLGYFIDPKVAFVQTPQDFYNLDSYQHRMKREKEYVWSEQSLFFRIIQRGKDYWNAALFCGCCAIIRRSALDSIGGFATGTVTEDMHTSVRLHKKGYVSIYHAESLAFGIAPTHIQPFLRQRIRWGQGAMQVWRREKLLFCRSLTIAQKLNYIASMITFYEGWQKFIFYVTPAIVLITGWLPLVSNTSDFLTHFVPYFVMMMWCPAELGRGYSEAIINEQYNMMRFVAFCFSTIGLFASNLKFKVTDKKMTRVAKSYGWYLLPQYGVLILNAVAILVGIFSYINFRQLPSFALSANLIWSSVYLALATIVLAFSLRRRRFSRHNYRFPIPLIARVRTAYGLESFAAVDNLSCAGLLILAPRVLGLKTGDICKGELYLPEGPVPFQALVRAMHDGWWDSPTSRAFGCEFVWNDRAALHRMDQFLYGSNLEHQIYNLTEKSETPLEWLLGTAYYKTTDSVVWSGNKNGRLSSMVLNIGDGGRGAVNTGIISIDERTNRCVAIVFHPLPSNKPFGATLFTSRGWKTMRAKVANRNIENQTSSKVYLYHLESVPA